MREAKSWGRFSAMGCAGVMAAVLVSACSGGPGGEGASTVDALSGRESLFGGVIPKVASASDSASVEVGVQFKATVAGKVSALRFYKGSGNGGTHVAHLWTASGQLLASATFTNETASGWQKVELATPVALTPGSLYVASYLAPQGHYADVEGYFTASGHSIGDLYALKDGESGSNGVYAYGGGGFPKGGWHGSNYFVDVAFWPASASAPDAGSPVTPPDAGTVTLPDAGTGGGTPKGFPDATDTGVPAGTTLTRVPADVSSGTGWHWDSRGWVVIDGANAVFTRHTVAGAVEVYAANAVIQFNDISNSGEGWTVGLRPGSSNVLVADNTMHGPCVSCTNRLTYGINGNLGGNTVGLQVLRNNLFNIDHPLQTESGLIEDNYVHDLAANNVSDHVDVFFSGGGDTGQLTLRHNSMVNDWTGDGATASIMLNNAFGVQSNRLIENNLLGGGGWTVYGGDATKNGVAVGVNVIIRNNQFTTRIAPKSGFYGPLVYLQSGAGDVVSGNVWADGPNAGKPVD